MKFIVKIAVCQVLKKRKETVYQAQRIIFQIQNENVIQIFCHF